MKARKKPVIINYMQFEDSAECFLALEGLGLSPVHIDYSGTSPQIVITTLEGDIRGDINDFIIKGVKGEFYPCKPDIFEATYERID